MVTLSPIDSALILLYFAAVVYVGFRASRKQKSDTNEFLLAGRTLTLPMFVATLVSTWYGGILGVGEFSYKFGISNWIVLGVPYYIFALVFALVLAKRIRATNLHTIPDKLEASYDRRTALLGSVLTFILVSPAAYVLMLGILVQLVFGLDLFTSVLLTTFLTVCYLYAGGFRSDVWANTFEFVMMFLGFAMILPFAYAKFGGLDFISSNVPSFHLTWHGGNSWQYVTVWFFIALWTLVDPAFHQRCYAAKDGKTAQRGIFISILFWFCFDFMTSTAGLYARAALPELDKPLFAYPMLAEITLPTFAKGLFYIGMLATIMSSLSSLMFISATTIGKDIVGRIKPGWGFSQSDAFGTTPELAGREHSSLPDIINRWTRIGLVISSVFAIAFALLLPSVVNIWYAIGTCIIPGLLVPVMASYFERLRIPASYAFWAMLLGWLTSTGSLIFGVLNSVHGAPLYFYHIEPMYPGLVVSLIVWAVGRAKS
ncbi:MAG: sodium:solute symporter family protein [Ignavibacteriae bacterium]|nr:sodium:solute symporter family protein [Ignavibacteriota bacterium]